MLRPLATVQQASRRSRSAGVTFEAARGVKRRPPKPAASHRRTRALPTSETVVSRVGPRRRVHPQLPQDVGRDLHRPLDVARSKQLLPRAAAQVLGRDALGCMCHARR